MAQLISLSLQHLIQYDNESQFLQLVVAGGETGCQHYTAETKNKSMLWKHPLSPPPRKSNSLPSAGIVMLTFFFDWIFIWATVDLVSSSENNSQCWTVLRNTVTDAHVHKAKTSSYSVESVIFLQHNVRPHTANATTNTLKTGVWKFCSTHRTVQTCRLVIFITSGHLRRHSFNNGLLRKKKWRIGYEHSSEFVLCQGYRLTGDTCDTCLNKYGD